MKKGVKVLTFIMASALLLTACQSTKQPTGGNSKPAATSSPAASTAPASTASTGGKVTLQFMHTRAPQESQNTSEAKIFQKHLDGWIAKNTNVEVKQTIMAQTDYQTKIMALSASGDMPDVYFTKGSWVGTFYKNGVMADLTSSIKKEEFRPGIFDPFTRDGKIYAVPYQCNVTSLVYYNEELWKQAGYDKFPDNWDDIKAADKKFKEKGIFTFAFGNKDKWNSESCIISTLGDRITGTDWTRSIIKNDKKAKFTDPEFIKTLETLQGMAAYFNPDFNAITHQQAAAYYMNAKAASGIDGIWNMGYLIKNGKEDLVNKTKVAVLPAVQGGKGDAKTTSGGPVWSQSVNAKLKGDALKAATDLTLALYNKEYSQFIMDDSGMPSVHVAQPKDVSKLKPISQSVLALVNSIKLIPIYDGEMEASVIEIMNTNLQTLLGGTSKPADVAKLIQDAQEKLK